MDSLLPILTALAATDAPSAEPDARCASLTAIRKRAKKEMRVHDADVILQQIIEWSEEEDLARVDGDQVRVEADLREVRRMWRKRNRDESEDDDEDDDDATQGDDSLTRRRRL